MDLTGKLIIKATLGPDIRRIPIHNDDLTYDELILMMQRVYRGQLSSSDDITLKYKDEDGDLITIFDSADLAFAIAYSKVLKLTLFVNGKMMDGGGMSGAVGADVKTELREIRDRVNRILDKLGDASPTCDAGDSEVSTITSSAKSMSLQNGKAEGKEFDPLQKNGVGGEHEAATGGAATPSSSSVASGGFVQPPLSTSTHAEDPQSAAPPAISQVQPPQVVETPQVQQQQQPQPTPAMPPHPATSAASPMMRPPTSSPYSAPGPGPAMPPAMATRPAYPAAPQQQQQQQMPPRPAMSGGPPSGAFSPQPAMPPSSTAAPRYPAPQGAFQPQAGYAGQQQQQQPQPQQQQAPPASFPGQVPPPSSQPQQYAGYGGPAAAPAVSQPGMAPPMANQMGAPGGNPYAKPPGQTPYYR